MKTVTKIITKAQYYQLFGLREASKQIIDKLEFFTKMGEEITGDEEMGHTSDFIWGYRELDEMLDALGIGISE